jgi:hypothetical protein
LFAPPVEPEPYLLIDDPYLNELIRTYDLSGEVGLVLASLILIVPLEVLIVLFGEFFFEVLFDSILDR